MDISLDANYISMAIGVTTTLIILLGFKLGMPLWEAKKMNAEKEKTQRKMLATDMWWVLKNHVQDGDLSVDDAERWVRLFHNTTLPEILPPTVKNLKEVLQEKHPKPQEVTAQDIPKAKLSLLARVAERKKLHAM